MRGFSRLVTRVVFFSAIAHAVGTHEANAQPRSGRVPLHVTTSTRCFVHALDIVGEYEINGDTIDLYLTKVTIFQRKLEPPKYAGRNQLKFLAVYLYGPSPDAVKEERHFVVEKPGKYVLLLDHVMSPGETYTLSDDIHLVIRIKPGVDLHGNWLEFDVGSLPIDLPGKESQIGISPTRTGGDIFDSYL